MTSQAEQTILNKRVRVHPAGQRRAAATRRSPRRRLTVLKNVLATSAVAMPQVAGESQFETARRHRGEEPVRRRGVRPGQRRRPWSSSSSSAQQQMTELRRCHSHDQCPPRRPPGACPSPGGRGAVTAAADPSRRPARLRRIGLPYLLLLPALLFELLVHLIPMVVGRRSSASRRSRSSTCRNWRARAVGRPRQLPDRGRTSTAPIGQALLHSFVVTCAFTALAVGLSWLFGSAAAILAQDTFRGRGAAPRHLPDAVRAAGVRVGHHLGVHVPVQQRPGQPRAAQRARHHQQAVFWLLGDNSFFALVIVSVWRNWPFAFLVRHGGAAVHPARPLRGRGDRRGRGLAADQARSRCRHCGRSTRCSSWCCSCGPSTTSRRRSCCSATRRPQPADVISIHIYNASFLTWNFGEGSAMSVLLLLFLLVVSGGYLLFTSRRRDA